MKTIFTKLLLIFFVNLYYLDLAAQVNLLDQKFKFDNISIQEGLSQSTVLSTFQDSNGFMWIGTRDGLNKFNGYSFEIYQNKINDSSSICGNIINDIIEDQDKNLWIATDKGLSKFNNETKSFINFPLPVDQFTHSEVQVIKIDKYNRIWVGTRSGLLHFDLRKYHHITDLNTNLDWYAKASVHSLHIHENDMLWIGTTHKGLYTLKLSADLHAIEFIQHIGSELFNDSWVESITSCEIDSIWIGTYGSGLYLLNSNGEILKNYHSNSLDLKNRIAHNNIRALSFDNDKNLWIGTFEGLSILRNDFNEVINILYEKGDKNGLSHGSIRSISKDKKGSLWIGTYFGGLNIYDKDNQKFAHYYNIPGNPKSLSYNVVGAFSEDKSGNIIIGTERGGINFFNKEDQNHSTYIDKNNNFTNGLTIKSIYTDTDENIWIGTFKNGLQKFNKQSNKLKEVSVSQTPNFNQLKNAIVNCIAEDQNGILWLGLDGDGGIVALDKKNEQFVENEISLKLKNSLSATSVKNILIDNEGNFWISTRGDGIYFYNSERKNLKSIKSLQYNNKTLEVIEVNHIHENNQFLWIATHGNGVLKIEKESLNVADHYYDANGLLSNTVFGSLQDNLGQLWFVTLNGISKINIRENGDFNFKNYPYSAGFPIQEINEGSFFKTKSGEFLIGGSNGYVRFLPQEITDNQTKPPVVFTNLKIANQIVKPGDKHGILNKAFQNSAEITLDYFQSVVTFEFAALNYLRPENNQYAYQLEGFQNDWNYIGNNRSATFTNLEDGTYLFKVKASNNDGVWNEEAALLTIHVLPPPWKTWWAFIIYAVLILSGFIIIRQNAIKGAKMKMDLKLEQLEKERWKEIHQLKLKYFTDVSHEFRTPLTLITNPLEEILDSDKGGKWIRKRLKTMYFNSRRMLLLIDQILEIRELETGHSKLKLTPINVAEHVGNVVDSFKTLADKKNIRLNFQYEDFEGLYMVDIDKLEKIFYNLLSNAFKFTPDGGTITVSMNREVSKANDLFHFRVSDTGIGIEKNNIKKVFDRFYTNSFDNSGAGIGLSLTQSLIELQEGTIQIEKSDNKGTIFYMVIPYEKANSKDELSISKSQFNKPIPLELSPAFQAENKKNEDEEFLKEDTLLIVEDTLELRNYLKEQLGKKYKIVTAKNGSEALEKVRKTGASLILSDVMMPEMDGFELCEKIKAEPELCHIPIILLTAKSSHVNRLEGLEFGADDYISKPFIMREVKSRIKNILNNRKILQEKFKQNSFLPDLSKVNFNSFDEKLLKKLIQTVEDNIDEPTMTVEFLSKELALSRVHLFRKLKSLTGMNPTEFIKDFRMKRAAQLLELEKLNISEVAYSIGFQDVHYFGKCFKKTFGVSPSQYAREKSEPKVG